MCLILFLWMAYNHNNHRWAPILDFTVYRRYLISDTELFSPISDHSDIALNSDTRYQIVQSDINLADIGFIRNPIFKIIDSYHTFYKNYTPLMYAAEYVDTTNKNICQILLNIGYR
jgi:hypothetical protein